MSQSPYQLKDDRYSSHTLILAVLGEGRGRRALDAGAADGFLSERLTQRGWRVTAIERDPVLAARARPRCETLVVGDLGEVAPALDRCFDAIVLGDVLEHLTDPLAVLRALRSALAPGGRIVVSVPNVAHVWVRLQLLAGRFEYADRGILDRGHLRFFTRKSFLRLLTDADLHVEALRSTPVPLPLVVPARLRGRWLDTVHAASAVLARCWHGGLAYQFVAVCRPAKVRPVTPTAVPIAAAAPGR